MRAKTETPGHVALEQIRTGPLSGADLDHVYGASTAIAQQPVASNDVAAMLRR